MNDQLGVSLIWDAELPPNWKLVRFGSVVDEVRHPNKEGRWNNRLSLSYGRIVPRDIASADGLLPETFNTYNRVAQNDVVLRLTDLQNDKRSLRTALANEAGIITSAYVAVRPHAVEPRFLAYYLQAADQAKLFYSMGGGLRQSIGFGDIKAVRLPLPPAIEQHAIADYLDYETNEIDAFVDDLKSLISLETERTSAIVEDFIWSTDSPEISLRRVIESVDQGHSPEADSSPAAAGGVGLLKAGCTNFGVFNPAANKSLAQMGPLDRFKFVERGDLIVTRASGSLQHVGSAAVVPELDRKLAMSDKHYRIRTTPNYSSDYLALVMMTGKFKDALRPEISGAQGLARNVSLTSLKSMRVPSISPNAQVHTLEVVRSAKSAATEVTSHATRAIELANERRAALVSAAVTGQIDVTQRHRPVVEQLEEEVLQKT